nr:hypothetical protein [Bowdeniella nasicola]
MIDRKQRAHEKRKPETEDATDQADEHATGGHRPPNIPPPRAQGAEQRNSSGVSPGGDHERGSDDEQKDEGQDEEPDHPQKRNGTGLANSLALGEWIFALRGRIGQHGGTVHPPPERV